MLQHDIEQLEEYFKEYPDQDSTQKLGKIKSELKSQQYKIAVVANMSAGKSTFINALFGADILPTSTKATTDCATYIFSKEGIRNRFKPRLPHSRFLLRFCYYCSRRNAIECKR